MAKKKRSLSQKNPFKHATPEQMRLFHEILSKKIAEDNPMTKTYYELEKEAFKESGIKPNI